MFNKNLLRDSFFDDINGMSLDNYQRRIVVNNNKSLLVVAGAGSGKTLTIIGKVKYLIERLGYNPKDILLISFTNETVNNLINKISYPVNVYTFHKLSISIIRKARMNVIIENGGLLEFIVDDYFNFGIVEDNLTKAVIYYYLDSDVIISYSEFCIKFKSDFNEYKNAVINFIKRIKTYNHWINDFKKYIKNASVKERYFLLIVFKIYSLYQSELISSFSVDFDDMISLASYLVSSKKVRLNYNFIIIDEYQDTSVIRYNLIKNIIDMCNSRIMCVGDDYQSIYKFSGCTLDLFINFRKYFSDSSILFIKNTYRNSYEVIDLSSWFVSRNPYQIKKRLFATKLLKNCIKLVYYSDNDYSDKFYCILNYLYNLGERNVLVLGRYNDDYKYVFKSDVIEYLDMNISFMSVHASKGLECDNVIILNMEDKYKGFPSKIKDFDIFRVFDGGEDFLYAEERRLFYVALTRCKKNVFIMSHVINPSSFILEIKSKVMEFDF